MHQLGIDVSKNKLDAALLRADQTDKFLSKKIAPTLDGFEKLLQWSCEKAHCSPTELQILMEATGPYHEKLAHWMYQKGVQVSVINPARIKKFAQSEGRRAKNDKLDAQVIARFGRALSPTLWKPAPQPYRELQALLNRLEALQGDLQRESNRWEKLQSGDSPSSLAIESIQRTLDFLQNEQKQLESLLKNHLERHPDLKQDQALLESIPGIGPKVAPWINALLQHQTRFQSARQVAAFVGLTPTEHTSGKSVFKKARLSKAGASIYRKKLYMCAIVASKYNPDVKALYERLIQAGKTPMSALGAAMRKLIHICFGVIKHQTKYQPQISLNQG